jgi:DNA-directed RNA polymerase subunit N
MMIPVRCFSCGKVLGSLYEAFQEKVKNGESPEKALDSLGVPRYCCRRMLFTQADLIDDIMKYRK